jgi:hypothetical protein
MCRGISTHTLRDPALANWSSRFLKAPSKAFKAAELRSPSTLGPIRIYKRLERLSAAPLRSHVYAALGAIDEEIYPKVTVYYGPC